MIFARPEALWLLIPVLGLALAWGRRAPGPAVLRAMALAMVVVALGRPVQMKPETPLHVVCIVDRSASAASVEEVAARIKPYWEAIPKGAQAHLVAFAAKARRVAVARDGSDLASNLSGLALGAGSNAEAAFDLAAAVIPAGSRARLLYVGDGREDRGVLERGLARWRAQPEWEAHAYPMGLPAPHPIVLGIEGPHRARRAQTVTVRAHGSAPGSLAGVMAQWRDASGAEESSDLVVHADGSWESTTEVTVERVGENTIGFALRGEEGDAIPGSARRWIIEGREPARVLVASDPSGSDPSAALATLLGSGASVERVAALELTPAALEGAAALILADLPARYLPAAMQPAIKAAVSEGMALFATGGRRSFGPGGWGGTELEAVLPARFVQREERRDPSATLVVIIDTSGSMGGGRIDLAKEVARLALRRLKPHDKAGIVEFHGAKRWAAPIQSAGNSVDIQRALNRLNAGGGTVILPAIREAYYGLLNAKTRTRHVLVLTDGGVESGAFEPLIRRMAEEGMTLSTVLVGGSSAYSSFLVGLSQWGRGRFYHCPNRFNLPEIIVKQPESSLLSPWLEGASGLERTPESGALRGLDLETSRPQVAGLVELEPRAGAEVELSTEASRPLLMSWHYGLGRVSVWASELAGGWTGTLGNSPEYARLWAANLRRALPLDSGPELVVRPRSAGLGVWLRGVSVEQAVQLEVSDGTAVIATRPAARSSVGGSRTEALFGRLPRDRVYQVLARGAGGAVLAQAKVHLPPATEWTTPRPDRSRLTAAFDGRIDSRPDVVAADGPQGTAPRVRGRELWRFCMVAALALGLLMILLRRWPVRPPAAASILLLALVLPATATAQSPPPAEAQSGIVADGEELPPLDANMLRMLALALEAPLERGGAADQLIAELMGRDGELGSLIAKLSEVLDGDGGKSLRSERLLLARAHFLEGRAAAAQKLVDAAAELSPLDRAGQFLAVQLNEILGEDEAAMAGLKALIDGANEPQERLALRVRFLGLALGRRDDVEVATQVLGRAVEEALAQPQGQHTAWFLAFLAALHGHPERILDLQPPAPGGKVLFHQHLMQGTWRLRAGRLLDARASFRAALEHAPLRRDRRFAQERLIASYRERGDLAELAAAWAAEQNRPGERTDALVAILRELGRPEDALNLLMAERASEGSLSRETQQEIIALALESGREEEVLRIYHELIAAEPARLAWRSGLALLHLLRGRRAEADAVWRDAAQIAGGEHRGLSIARAAADVAQLEVAREVAEQAAKASGEPRARALLFLADLDRRDGDSEGARQRLLAVEKEFADDDETMALVVDAWEKAQQKTEALRVLEAVAARSDAEDLVMRLAWGYESRKQVDEAIDTWLALFNGTKIPARARQAVDRLLDLGARKARLADLAIDLEKKLQAKEGDARDLAFLVRIYERAGDAVAAVEVLREFGAELGQDEVSMLTEMARVYQQCDDYRRYDQALRKLKELDPDNSDDYQQQLALGALERGKGKAARRALEVLLLQARDPMTAQEFAAGVLAMVQLPKASVRAYGRVLSAFPDRIETHLLRANVRETAGEGVEACRGFLRLMEEAEKGDLFTVAVDGVLNLEGRGGAYAVAWRRVLERLAAQPDKAYLYQLAADLAEEQRQPERQLEMTELMAIVAGERRASVLRELMEMAAQRQRPQDLLSFGRGLIAVGEVMPPEVFLDLGEALVETGDLATAERVFARAKATGDFVGTQRRIAKAYEEAGFLDAAERALRQALIAKPDDAELVLDAAEAALACGAFERVARDYRQATAILVRNSPSRVAEGEGQATRVIRTPFGTRIVRVGGSSFNRNKDPFEQLQARLFSGLEASADRETVEFLAALIDEEIELLQEASQLAEKPADNLRLYRLASLIRKAALAAACFDEADAIDAKLRKVWSGDDAFAKNAVEERLRSGLFHRARMLSQRLGLDTEEQFAELRRESWLSASDAELRTRMEKESPPLPRVLELMPSLLLAGRDAMAGELLASFNASAQGVTYARAMNTERLVRRLLGDEAAQPWFLRWARESLDAKNARSLTHQFERRIREHWDELDEKTHDELKRLVVRAQERANDANKAAITRVLTNLAEVFGLPEPDAVKPDLAGELEKLRKRTSSGYALMSAFCAAPFELQPQLIEVLQEHSRKLKVSSILNQVTRAGREVHPDVHGLLVEAFKRDISSVNKASWNYYTRRLADSATNAVLCRQLLDEVAKALPDEPAVRLQSFRSRIGEAEGEERAAVLAELEAWTTRFLTKTSPSRGELQVLERLLDDASEPLREVARRQCESAAEAGTLSPALLTVLAKLRQRQGRLKEALALIDQNEVDDPRLRDASHARRRNILLALGRRRQSTASYFDWLSQKGDTNPWLFNNVAQELVKVGRPLDGLEALTKAKQRADASFRVRLLLHLGREDEARQELRRLVSKRWNSLGDSWSELRIDSHGPLASKAESRAEPEFIGQLRDFPSTLIGRISQLPFAANDLTLVRRRLLSKPLHELDDMSLAIAWMETRGRELEVAGEVEAAFAGVADPSRLAVLQLLLLGSRKDQPLPENLVAALDELERRFVVHGLDDSAEGLGQLARMHLKDGRMVRARRILGYLVTNPSSSSGQPFFERRVASSSISSSVLLVESIGNRNRSPEDTWTALWLATFDDEERRARRVELLRKREPASIQPLTLPLALQLLNEWTGLNDPQEIARWEGAVRGLLESPPEGQSPSLQLRRQWLRWLAQQGRAEEVESLLSDAELVGDRLSPQALIGDYASLHDAPAIVAVWEAHLAEREFDGREAIEAWSEFGAWLQRGGDTARLASVLPRLSADEVESASAKLRIADLARAAGDEGRALRIERALLAEDALALDRIETVLDSVEAEEGVATAWALLSRVLENSEDAALLHRGFRYAESMGDAKRARELSERLRRNHPLSPLIAESAQAPR